MNLKNKETTNCTPIQSFSVKYRFAFHRVNFLTPIRSFFPTGQVGQANNINKLKKITTEYTLVQSFLPTPIQSFFPTGQAGQAEKNRTHRDHRATPHPPFLLCLFKTQPTTPKLTMDGHPGKGVHLRPILQGLEVGMRSITDVLGL